MVNFKTVFLEKFESEIESGSINSICDMGSGLSLNFLPILKKYPNITYVGIEPSEEHAKIARENLKQFKNARIYNLPGYLPVEDKSWGSFDLVISLSVLEHVKHIDRFLNNSVEAAKVGGRIVHRWDLGHAFYPSSIKERFQVWMGNNVPFLLPEKKFVCGILPEDVVLGLEISGCKVESVTYHQMNSHKKLFKLLPDLDEKLKRDLIDWEFAVSDKVANLEVSERIKLFPTACVWSRKM